MKSKHYSLVAAIILMATLPVTMNAKDWFVKADAATGGDGTTWQTALNASGLKLALSDGSMASGDVIRLAGGVYSPGSEITDAFVVTTGVSLIGGYSTNLTDTTIPELNYPTTTPTIISGQIDESTNNQHLMLINTTADTVSVCGITFRDAYNRTNVAANSSALYVTNTPLKMSWCSFLNNQSVYYGGGAITVSNNFSYLSDCIFTGNRAYTRGGAIRVDSKAVMVAERIEVSENKGYIAETIGTSEKFGGGIQVSSGTLWLLNSTVYGNEIYSNGGGIGFNGSNLYLISSTITKNVSHRAVSNYAYGSQMCSEKAGTLHIVNSYVVAEQDNGGLKYCPFYADNLTGEVSDMLITAGWNVGGTFYLGKSGVTAADVQTAVKSVFATTGTDDVYNSANTYANIFGTNGLVNNGGNSRTVIPMAENSGCKVSDLQDLVKIWGCPVEVDVTVDQRGYKRESVTVTGAIDPNATQNVGTSIATVGTIAGRFEVTALGDGRYAVSGIDAQVSAYDITGRLVTVSHRGVVDLSRAGRGIYVLAAHGQTLKIMR